MFAQVEFGRNVAVAQAVRDQRDNLLFPGSQQFVPICAYHAKGGHLADRVEKIIQLLRCSPDFSTMHSLDAFTEQLKRGVAETKKSSRTRTESMHRQFAALGVIALASIRISGLRKGSVQRPATLQFSALGACPQSRTTDSWCWPAEC